MKQEIRASIAAAALGVVCVAGSVGAQPQGDPGGLPPRDPLDRPGRIVLQEIDDWSGFDTRIIGEMLVGSWRSTVPVAEGEDPGSSVSVLLHIAKVAVEGLDDVMYVELARDDDPARPYRQFFLQILRVGEGVRLRTLEARTMLDGLRAYAGFWAIPELFPPLSRERIVPTMDIDLRAAPGGGFTGGSGRCPTNLFGAIEMETEIWIGADGLAFADRGYDSAGTMVWGATATDPVRFARFAFPLNVVRSRTGLVMLEYPSPVTRMPKEGELVRWAYSGWTWIDGRLFDTTDDSEMLPEYEFPPAGGMLNFAWEEAIRESGQGTLKRIVCPPERWYVAGSPADGVPPRSVVVFLLECVNISDAPPGASRPEGPAGEG
ncbi:MAG: FKBP-type peptidyl-prolyl cis-trans isomerase [Phycisphaeraceae bacterium]|nr:FKBP-type peptidyl-prolyl cis-trans isomerase [Phycisphaeraceae bacterium]